MPSDTLFLNHLLNAFIWLIFLQKRNANVKYKPPFTITPVILRLVSEISELVGHVQALSGSTSPFLRKENRIRTIRASLAIENNTLTLEQVTAVLNRKYMLGQAYEIQKFIMLSSHMNTWNHVPLLTKRHVSGPDHAQDGLMESSKNFSRKFFLSRSYLIIKSYLSLENL